MKEYSFKKTESKWQKYWEVKKLHKAKDFDKKKKFYCMVEFPYPSGDGLHVGHTRSYTALDVVARKKRMEGFNVMYPMGWDAFGLPTENYAIKKKIHPTIVTKRNADVFRRQLKSLAFSFDWDREINTTDPKYYKWTQWIFLQLFKKGLAYKKKTPINWCLSCKIGLANEEVIDGKCERCGGQTEKREKDQWMLAITKYADRLDKDLDKVDYLEKIKIQQRNWIGRSEGAQIKFEIKDSKRRLPSPAIEVFTTRVDTIFGCTFIVVAPEHPSIQQLADQITNYKEVQKYISESAKKSDLQRTELQKEKTGVELKGIKAINPFNKQEISVFVGDFVLGHYGTGAVMAVPAHDTRDFEFAKKHGLEIIESVQGEKIAGNIVSLRTDNKGNPTETNISSSSNSRSHIPDSVEQVLTDDGILVNSGEFTGLTSAEARSKMGDWLEKNKLGKKTMQFHLRDWVFSRQHYWGEPIPMVKCPKCALKDGQGWVPVPEKELPIKLPNVKNYEPTDTGESPLSLMTKWVNVKCPKCKGPAKRETDTMPNWAGSSWYFLRYIDPKNNKTFADKKKLKYWMPVDWYNGGMEHVTLHLLYSRFWNKFLYDIKAVPFSEPYKKRTSHGMVLGPDGEKMSKSRGNVINPDELVSAYGADAYRLYQLFMGPFDQAIPWDPKGIEGTSRFLGKVWNISQSPKLSLKGKNEKLETLLHKTIKKVSADIESTAFNTCVSAFMIFVNEAYSAEVVPLEIWKKFLIILAPFAPHMTEEIWQNSKALNKVGQGKKSIHTEKWPAFDKRKIEEESFDLVVQINGKTREVLKASTGIKENEALELVKKNPNLSKWIEGLTIRKTIFVPGRLINIIAN